MSEKKRTFVFGGVAIALALLAFVTAPRTVTPDAFLDKGEPFFPDFEDPNQASSMEVVDFDEKTGEAIPFKVVFAEGMWSIPSHYSYPADGKDRLAQTAAAVIELRKDDFRSDNVSDHELCGVIDPTDESNPALEGRGRRITLKGSNDQVLADIIVGDAIEDREGFHFVRLPDQKRIYASYVNLDISTRFSDWIESDLLLVDTDAIDNVVIKDYSINERTRRIDERDELRLTRDGSDWKANRLKSNEEVNRTKVGQLTKAIDELSIVGVRPKPAGLSQSLKRDEGGVQISGEDVRSLQSKGFYFGPRGNLVSNEGEMEVHTTDGIVYTLRFGEIAYGTGLALSAGLEQEEGEVRGVAENRYVFITAYFDEDRFPAIKAAADTSFLSRPDSTWNSADFANKQAHERHQRWLSQLELGRQKADKLRDRFADWYYVISAESYRKLDLDREDLIKEKRS